MSKIKKGDVIFVKIMIEKQNIDVQVVGNIFAFRIIVITIVKLVQVILNEDKK